MRLSCKVAEEWASQVSQKSPPKVRGVFDIFYSNDKKWIYPQVQNTGRMARRLWLRNTKKSRPKVRTGVRGKTLPKLRRRRHFNFNDAVSPVRKKEKKHFHISFIGSNKIPVRFSWKWKKLKQSNPQIDLSKLLGSCDRSFSNNFRKLRLSDD